MKTLYFSFFLMFNVFVAFSQSTVLTYDTHALLNGVDNPMELCEYTDPGISGENVTWDFSDLKFVNNFVGHLNASYFKNTNSNTTLEEFGTKFYFNVSKDNMQQVGYASQDNRTIITYTRPFERMRFPFKYGDSYSTTFGGDYNVDGKKIGVVDGTASVEGDACGTLILPGKTYKNTIRVKTVKTFNVDYENSSSFKSEITTYRWYCQGHRYPILVLTQIKNFTNGDPIMGYQAAYNTKAVDTEKSTFSLSENVSLFPNPTEGNLNLQIYSPDDNNALISVFDLTGRKLLVKSDVEISAGLNTISLNNEIRDLNPASYIIRIDLNSQSITREVTIINE